MTHISPHAPALKASCPSTKLTWFHDKQDLTSDLGTRAVKATSVPGQYQNNQVNLCWRRFSTSTMSQAHNVPRDPTTHIFIFFSTLLFHSQWYMAFLRLSFLINSGTQQCHSHFMFLPLKWPCVLLQQPLDAYYGNNYVSHSYVQVLTTSISEYDCNLFIFGGLYSSN